MILTEKDLELLNAIQASPVPETERNNDLKIEFDGTTVLCRVCGDKASGFHYGVHSCEGCKGFFRRSIQQKIQYRPCTKNQQCSILRINRNRCQYCRLKKCIAVGMSRDAVRFGRVPKREKAKILAAMQKVNASSQEKALGAELEDELKLLSTIVKAHEETCDYTKDKVQVLIEKAREHPVYAQCPPQLSCPLNSAPHITEDGASHYMEDFSERFTPAIQGVVEYAKRIPGFSFLSQDDQLTLLKAGVFEVLLVRLACMFDSQASTLISLNGQAIRRESIHSASNARFLLDSMFDFAERLNGLHLTDTEIGLFSAVVVIAADRPGLRNTDLVLKIQKKLMDILQKSIMANHTDNPNIFGDLMKKIPDLRTLNTLHSEKLLAYKMEPRNQTANGQTVEVPNGVSNSCPVVFNPNMYAMPHEIWSQYSLVATQQCLTIDEGQRSTSPSQHSQHSGTSTASEWSTTDSKDEHDLMGSPRSVGSGLCIEDAKSPIRTSSFSSSRSYTGEDIWPAEMGPQTADFHSSKRLRENGSEHGSSSGDEGYFVDSPVKGTVVYPKLRRVDSPTDSGIESGKEHSGPSTTPTISVCSSPRSAVDEKVKDVVEDMPVLKRALQAPPLVNTNMLMDEAYRHHKKFRAARRDADSPSSPSSISLASTHSTLVRTLEQAPRYLSEQQLKRTDLIHNIIMRTETLPGQQPQVTSQQPLPHHQNQQTSHSLSHELSPQQHQQLQQSNNGTTIGVHLTVNGQYPCVPNHSPVPPNFISSPQQHQQPQQQKNLLLCPTGYYIPHRNSSSPIYSAAATSWQFGQSSHTSTAISATSVSPSPIHIHTQFPSSASELEQPHQPASHNNSNMCPVNLHSPDQQQRSSASVMQCLSPRLVYSARSSPAAPGSPLVISGLSSAAAASSPPVCQLEPSRMSSPVQQQQQRQNESADSQPLNLSKKLFSPPMLKMES